MYVNTLPLTQPSPLLLCLLQETHNLVSAAWIKGSFYPPAPLHLSHREMFFARAREDPTDTIEPNREWLAMESATQFIDEDRVEALCHVSLVYRKVLTSFEFHLRFVRE